MTDRISIPPGLTLTDLIDVVADPNSAAADARRMCPAGAPFFAHSTLDAAIHRHITGIDSADDLRRQRAVCHVATLDHPKYAALRRLADERANAIDEALADAATRSAA